LLTRIGKSQWREYFKTYAPEKSESQKLVKQEQRQIQSIPDSSINSNGIDLAKGERLEPLSTIAARIAGNMQESLEIPTATSLRTMPVKALDENRRIINKHLLNIKRRKVSFTHLLAWAIVRGIVKYPHLNSSFAQVDGKIL
jgi:2-oxoglutarate dehydrogenase E1 component